MRDGEDGPGEYGGTTRNGNGAPSLPAPADALRTLRDDLDSHGESKSSLLILCDLIVQAHTADQYQERRHGFLAALGEQRFSSATVARVLRHVAIDLPPVRWENRDSLVHAVFDNTADDEAVMLCLVSMRDEPSLVRRVLYHLAQRANPFPLLARLLSSTLLESFRGLLQENLVDAAKSRRQVLHRWARANCADFLLSDVFQPLFEEGTDLIGSVCKEILTEGAADDRAMVIRRLQAEGTETALRILVLGAYGRTGSDEELIEALASFRHPLATATLREMVHRANTRDVDSMEANTALKALHDMDDEEGRQFLMEVIRGRVLFLPKYRRELRQLAQRLVAAPMEERA